MYPSTTKSTLTLEQRRLLDDRFFSANPMGYWRSRIDVLLAEPSEPRYTEGLAAAVVDQGIDPGVLSTTTPTDDERDLQRRLDAWALRHHIAESLVRLVHVLLTTKGQPDVCIWAALADHTLKTHELRSAFEEIAREPIPAGYLFVPESNRPVDEDSVPEDLQTAVRSSWAWVWRALDLLHGEELELNTGHNKLKHGLAVVSQNDVRISVTAAPPDSEGNLPLSAFNEALDVIDDVSAEYLAVQRGRGNPHEGSWEVTTINLRTPQILAEALMMSIAYGAAFAQAAERHFAGSDQRGPRHPGLALGPDPKRLVNGGAAGMRQPLTAPRRGGKPRAGIILTPGAAIPIHATGVHSYGRVVDDDAI